MTRAIRDRSWSDFSMDFLFNMNILGISGEEVEGCGGLRGAHVGDFNILKMDGCL